MSRPHNPTPLTPDRSELAARYLPFARGIARPFKAQWPAEAPEFESAACFALVEAAQTFDPGRDVKFATYARFRIWGAMRDVQRGLIRTGWRDDAENAPGIVSLAARAEEFGEVLLTTPDPPIGAELERAELLESWFRKLPPRHAAACRAIYLRGESHAQAAEALRTSKSRVATWLGEALVILRDIAATSPAFAGQSRRAAGTGAEGSTRPTRPGRKDGAARRGRAPALQGGAA